MTNDSLVKVESIVEYPHLNILQYFWPALSDKWSWKPFFDFLRVAVLHRFYCTFWSTDRSVLENEQNSLNWWNLSDLLL